MKREPGLLLQLRLTSGILVTIAFLLISGCAADENGMEQPMPQQSQQQTKPPRVIDWYPSPKITQPQIIFSSPQPSNTSPPAPGQWVSAQPSYQENVYQNPPVPQAWIIVPAPAVGYGGQMAGYSGQYNAGPAAVGVWQQAVPVWNLPAQQTQPYYPQQPVQQPQYQYPPVPQGVYTQRPWGQISESDKNNNSAPGMNAWQNPTGLPVWGTPGYIGGPMPYTGYYGTNQGTVVSPGIVWK
jgi:hypothetical protein